MKTPKIIARASSEMTPLDAQKFLHSCGAWDWLPPMERVAFINNGVIYDTSHGTRLAQLIAQRSAESVIRDRHFKKN